jgi:hypothetical protein
MLPWSRFATGSPHPSRPHKLNGQKQFTQANYFCLKRLHCRSDIEMAGIIMQLPPHCSANNKRAIAETTRLTAFINNYTTANNIVMERRRHLAGLAFGSFPACSSCHQSHSQSTMIFE